ncbi:MAG: helix-turn-helix domain-containing protein [Clostridiales bacterium]|nr:helix-turn-helix domain-containing protein [Clostridiales bacterium]
MECKEKIKELRERTGMNRKEFCEYFQIPYRTVTEWELGNRHAPDYVLRLLEYYIRMEKIRENDGDHVQGGNYNHGREDSEGDNTCKRI